MKTQTPRQWLLDRHTSADTRLDEIRCDTLGARSDASAPVRAAPLRSSWLRPALLGALGIGVVAVGVALFRGAKPQDLPAIETGASRPAGNTDVRGPATGVPRVAPARAVMAAEASAPGSSGGVANPTNELIDRMNQVRQTLAQVERQARQVSAPPMDSDLPEQRVAAPGSTAGDIAPRTATATNGTVMAEVPPPKIYPLKELNVIPAPVLQSPPIYPEELKRAGVGGSVTVHFVVNESGVVLDARVVTSTDKRFEAPALDTVRKWKFRPGSVGGRIVSTEMEVPINFHLPGAF